MAITNPQHLQFIEKCVEYHRDHIRAAMEVYGYKDRKTGGTQSNRLLKNAEIKAEIDNRLQKIKDISTTIAVKEVKKRVKATVLSMVEKRMILASIARGTYKVKIPYIDGKGKQRYMIRQPLPNEARLAMDLDAQLMGEKAAEKREISGVGGQALIPDKPVKLDAQSLDELVKQMNAKVQTGQS